MIAIGVEPNGLNINDGCGSTDPNLLKETVVASGADIGLALDGDADRLIVVDEEGETVDGDQLMALIGSSWHRRGRLRGGGIVSTVMSNLGLERYLSGLGLKLERTQVGDRYVLEAMRARAIMSAASSPATSSSPNMRRPATGWSRGCRSSPSWSRRTGRRASC